MCLNPRVLIHPSLKILCGLHGLTHIHTPQGSFLASPYDCTRLCSEIDNKSNPDDINNQYYVFNPATGESHPLFFFAPCNNCSECVVSRYSELASRLQFEVLSHDSSIPVIFFTLTYDDDHLPPDGVCRAHITDFVNKLHLYLHRAGISSPFRHFIVSEYGTDPRYTRRAHYHGLLFGLDLRRYGDVRIFNEVFHKCWPRCRYERAVWEFARSNHAISRYCCKYLIKQRLVDCVPPGKNPNFYSSPRVGGGLGSRALLNPELLDKILHSTDGTISVKCPTFMSSDSISLGVQRIRIPRFIIDKLFPPVCRYFTSNLRRALQWLVHSYNHILRISDNPSLVPSPRKFFKEFSLFFFRSDFFGVLGESKSLSGHIPFSPDSQELTKCINNYEIIWNYVSEKVSFLQSYKHLLTSRRVFLTKLFSKIPKPEWCSCDVRVTRNKSFLDSCLISSTLDANLKQ